MQNLQHSPTLTPPYKLRLYGLMSSKKSDVENRQSASLIFQRLHTRTLTAREHSSVSR